MLSAISLLSFSSMPLLIGIAFTSAPTSIGIDFVSGLFARSLSARRRSSASMRVRGSGASISGNGCDVRDAREPRDQEDRAQQQVDDVVLRQVKGTTRRRVRPKRRAHDPRRDKAQRAEQQVNGSEDQRERASGARRSDKAEIERQRGRDQVNDVMGAGEMHSQQTGENESQCPQ